MLGNFSMSELLVEAEESAEEDVEQNETVDTDPPRNSDADALFILGMRYSSGRGVEQDLVAAHKWFKLAAMIGHEGALAARAELSTEMTAAQIAEAQKLARDWLWKRNERDESKAAGNAAKDGGNAVVRPLYVRRKAQAIRSTRAFARMAG
jgi:TPR repeat protein